MTDPHNTSAHSSATSSPPSEASTGSDLANKKATKKRSLPVGPLGFLLVTLVALMAAALVVQLIFGSSGTDAVDVQDALNEQAAQPLVPPSAKAAQVGEIAPDVRLEYLDGGIQQLSELQGLPVVLNFWASTCAPCLTEMPAFDNFRAKNVGKVTVVGVDVADSEADGKAMMAKTAVSYRSAKDPRAELMRVFGGTSLPRTVILGSDGRVKDFHSGALNEDELTAKMKQLELLP